MQELGATIFKAAISISFRIKKKTYRFVIIYKQEISVVFLERMVAHCISFCYHMENCCQVVAIVLREILQNFCLHASIFHISQKLLFECTLRKNGDMRDGAVSQHIVPKYAEIRIRPLMRHYSNPTNSCIPQIPLSEMSLSEAEKKNRAV